MIEKLTDINDHRLDIYRSLKMNLPGNDGVFIAESRPAVKALIKSGLKIVSCLTTDKMYTPFARENGLADAPPSFPVYLMRKEDIENIIGFRFHHGIMMAAKPPGKLSVKDISFSLIEPHLILALNGIHDPQNVGLLLRNAAAFGADAVIVDESTYEPFYRKVVRISMGTIFNLRILHESDISHALETLKEKYGTKIIVTSLGEESTELPKAALTGNICLVLGNEFSGASQRILDIADMSVRIPHFFDMADSLNVACAGAICLYQAFSSRR